MQLVIDLGNTQAKVALFNGTVMEHLEVFAHLEGVWLQDFVAANSTIKSAILASVIHEDANHMKILKGIPNFFKISHSLPVPIYNKYTTPNTLGHDRLAAAVAGNACYPRQNVLVIDAGTCIKYDMITARAEYLGGGIAPGLMMRMNALQHFTQKLPLVFPKPDVDLIGNSTENSILSGVVNGILAEVDGIIARYKEQYFDLKVIVSGGDAKFLAKNLKSNIFVAPHLVLEGLNKILIYNVENE